MRLDLHMHSTASDGRRSPEEVMALAAKGRLDVVALSDHDTTAGVRRAQAAALELTEGRGTPLAVIPAIEVSSTRDGDELHFLGYFVDPDSPELVAHGVRALARRSERMEHMVSRLRDQGVEVTMEGVLEAAGPERHTLARPHLARALVEAGHAQSVSDAFDRFIGNEHDAFVPTHLMTPEEAVALIRVAGGVPVWAHPPEWLLEEVLPSLLDAGLEGLECYRPLNSNRLIRKLETACREHDLLTTGGSDWHSEENGRLGDFYVTGGDVSGLLARGGM